MQKNLLQVVKYNDSFTLIWTHGLVVKVCHRGSGESGSIPIESLCSPSAMFYGVALSPSVHWHARFLYCCALYNVFFLGFRQWRSRTDRVLTLNMNIWLPLFWSTWSRALGPDLAGPWIVEITSKHAYSEGFSTLEPQTECCYNIIAALPYPRWLRTVIRYLSDPQNPFCTQQCSVKHFGGTNFCNHFFPDQW